jgi:hypothetical protein
MLHSTTAIPRSFAATFDRTAERTIAPSWAARATARLAARWLDRELVAGADPAQSPALAARACGRTSDENRSWLAAAIDRLVRTAAEPPSRWGVTPHRAAVTREADELTDLAARLRSPAPLYVRGIAMLGRLISDGTGPAYAGEPEALSKRLGEARRALAG